MSGVAILRGRAKKAPFTTWITAQKVSDILMSSYSETIPLSHTGSAKPRARIPGASPWQGKNTAPVSLVSLLHLPGHRPKEMS